jgi:hypothetical protein
MRSRAGTSKRRTAHAGKKRRGNSEVSESSARTSSSDDCHSGVNGMASNSDDDASSAGGSASNSDPQ